MIPNMYIFKLPILYIFNYPFLTILKEGLSKES